MVLRSFTQPGAREKKKFFSGTGCESWHELELDPSSHALHSALAVEGNTDTSFLHAETLYNQPGLL